MGQLVDCYALGSHDTTTAIAAWRRLEHHTRGAGTLLEEVVHVGGDNDFGPISAKERSGNKRYGGVSAGAGAAAGAAATTAAAAAAAAMG
jgi:hypothetical protein